MVERLFRRDVGALEEIFSFVAEFLSSRGLDAAHSFEIDLLIEELFTNMVKYAGGSREILIGLDHSGPRVTIRLTDFDVDEFDVTRAPEVDTRRPPEERRAGGLGIHFVRQVAEEFRYDYADRTGTVTVTRRLDS